MLRPFWRSAFAVQAVLFAPLALLLVNPEWVFPVTGWFFTDETLGRLVGGLALFVVVGCALAARELYYPRVEVVALANLAASLMGAIAIGVDVSTAEHPTHDAKHHVLLLALSGLSLMWFAIVWIYAGDVSVPAKKHE
ncbi:uncharacterized protein AMSG_00097 [Thecamonas trahens ATCC 50062]|uniref:Transmembrane protein n=1 Tax=Thecamonas trahens ATCC 50062 TaxID=461836 RepID=A0A0L0D1G5_THETB|nr:hypothetical protein AMSG_00097 [Thecamonas trahens ATCC 50062]KNC45980.1 hypothetical protein AMSG_00097 [Thecamonas trahens ATCC 50062]|eukprot:XP_013762961.1 hypothetical protein AMSG_00097 [Thecamonas trahens ATCC 50062]